MRSLTFFGTRGSFPIEGRRFETFGGATTCCFFSFESAAVMVDCGSGAAASAEALREAESLHLLISHGHLDHISGIVALIPLLAGRPLHVYATKTAREALISLMRPPLWPVALTDFDNVFFHEPYPSFRVGDVSVKTMDSNHVGGATLYRLTEGGDSAVTAFDFNHAGGFGEKLTEFARDCSLLIYDGSMTRAEYAQHPDWGHSTPENGCEIARKAGARRLIVTHHGSLTTDEFLLQEEKDLQSYFPNVSFAREGQRIVF